MMEEIIIITDTVEELMLKEAEEIKWSDETSREKSICTVDVVAGEDG
jgi:hypothetical protein